MIITELCEHGSVSDVIQLTVRISQPNSTILISAEKREQICEHMQWAGRVRLMLDAAKGMLYLHNKDLLHCDLKSLNLLIDKTWTCKVADFGLSRCERVPLFVLGMPVVGSELNCFGEWEMSS